MSAVSGAAVGHWPHILSALGIKVPPAGRHGACPACGGKDRFRLDDKEGRGTAQHVRQSRGSVKQTENTLSCTMCTAIALTWSVVTRL